MSYFADRRKAAYEVNKAAIETQRSLSPYADYEGGKYEPMQYDPAILPTLAQLNHQQANYDFYFAKLQKIQANKPVQERD